jgi:hypothetical protein
MGTRLNNDDAKYKDNTGAVDVNNHAREESGD